MAEMDDIDKQVEAALAGQPAGGAAPAAGGEAAAPAGAAKAKAPGNGGSKRILLLVGIIILCGGAGFAVSRLMGGPSHASASQGVASKEGESSHGESSEHGQPPAANLSDDQEYEYYDFEPIVVNLDDSRLARYVRATITLAISAADSGQKKSALAALEKRKPELKNWLTIYLAGCTLEEVRGNKNLNRLQREIMDAFNDQLWPDQKPLIHHVLFKEFAIQ